MKKYFLYLTFTIVASSLFAQNDSAKTKAIKTDSVIYTCSMHPEILSDKPGKCPKCGMALIQKKSSSSDHKMGMMMMMNGMGGIAMGAVMVVMMTVMIIIVVRH